MIAASVASHKAARSASLSSSTCSTRSCGGGRTGSDIRSGHPAQKVGQDANTNLLAFLNMKLRTGAIASGDESDNRPAIVGGRDRLRGFSPHQGVTMHEI